MRFYGFEVGELLNKDNPHLDIDIDPKFSWALRNLHYFPVDINTATKEQILRIPGIGNTSALKILQARKFGKLRTDQLKKIGIAYNRAKHFMTCLDSEFSLGSLQGHQIKSLVLCNSKSKTAKLGNMGGEQLSLF